MANRREYVKIKYIPIAITVFILTLTVYGLDSPKSAPVRVIAELNIGELQDINLGNGKTVKLKVFDIHDIRDSLRDAIRVGLRLGVSD